jgi:hypothetical protein
LIAALEALRHPKAGLSEKLRYPKAALPEKLRYTKIVVGNWAVRELPCTRNLPAQIFPIRKKFPPKNFGLPRLVELRSMDSRGRLSLHGSLSIAG